MLSECDSADTVDPPGGSRGDPETVGELLDYPLRRGDVAVHVTDPPFYVVTRRREEPAGAIVSDYGATLDEWHPIDADADVVDAVPVHRLTDCPARVRTFDDAIRAVEDGLVRPRSVPERWLAPALEEFADARDRGVWDGLRDYVRGEG